MKKTIKSLAVVMALFIGISSVAKAQSFDEGVKVFSLGYGFPNLTKNLMKAVDDGLTDYTTKVTGAGPIHFRFEYGLSETWGIGASVNFASAGMEETYVTSVFNNNTNSWEDKTYTDKTSYRSISLLIRFNKHWPISDKADIFSGVGVGYKSNKWTWESTDPSATDDSIDNSLFPVGFEWTVGLRYYFTDNIGAYVEGGMAKSILQFGLAIKLD